MLSMRGRKELVKQQLEQRDSFVVAKLVGVWTPANLKHSVPVARYTYGNAMI